MNSANEIEAELARQESLDRAEEEERCRASTSPTAPRPAFASSTAAAKRA